MTLPEKVRQYLKAKQAYYFSPTPIMSDLDFDKLEDEIREEDPNEPCLKLVGAPVPKTTPHEKATHLIPMGSQERVKTWEQLQRWERLRANNTEARFHASYKGDGASIGLYYYNGRLETAITRGEGEDGENISVHASLFQGVPLQLPEPLNIGIRCEAILTLKDWKIADPSQKSNPRSLVAGMLGRLDTEKSHLVTAFAFDFEALPGTEDEEQSHVINTESLRSKTLQYLGFTTLPYKDNLTLEEVKDYYEETLKTRVKDKLPFWIDGIIVRYEDIPTQKKLGITDGRPKGQVAWKFPEEIGTSSYLGILWQVGSTGAVTPVIIIKPVRLGGSTVTRASLANANKIKTLGLFEGAEVEVVKGGDIIPNINKVLNTFDPAQGHTQIEIPANCPICDSILENKQNVDGTDTAAIFCVNPECEGQTMGRIEKFCKNLDIQGLGPSIITALLAENRIQTVPDLYRMTPESIQKTIINQDKQVKLGQKRAETICQEVQDKGTKMSLEKFLGAFGIRHLAIRRTSIMIQANPKLEELEAWFNDTLLDPEEAKKAGVPKLAAVIHEDIKDKEEIIRGTLEFVEITKSTPATAAPGGKIFCITGSLPSGKKKKEYAPELEAIGCQLADDLTKEVNFLVLSDPSGPESSKTKKAKKMNIPLMSEEKLIDYIKENQP